MSARDGIDAVIRQTFYGGHYSLLDLETCAPNPVSIHTIAHVYSFLPLISVYLLFSVFSFLEIVVGIIVRLVGTLIL